MNIKHFSFVKTCLLVVALSCFGLSTASADHNAAVVIMGNGCSFFDGDGGFVFSTDTHTTATQSANGNTMLRCRVKDVANSTGKAVRYDSENNPTDPGTGCLIANPFPLITDDWHEIVSASGVATLVCRVTGSP